MFTRKDNGNRLIFPFSMFAGLEEDTRTNTVCIMIHIQGILETISIEEDFETMRSRIEKV